MERKTIMSNENTGTTQFKKTAEHSLNKLTLFCFLLVSTLLFGLFGASLAFASGVMIKSAANAEKCLDADTRDGGGNKTNVQLWECHGEENQQWIIDDRLIKSVAYPGKCLDADTTWGGIVKTNVQLYECHGEENQQWIIDGQLIKSVAYDGKCLDADDSIDVANETNVQLWECHGETNQQWINTSKRVLPSVITVWVAAYIPQPRLYLPPSFAGNGDDRGPSGGFGASSKAWGFVAFDIQSDGTIAERNQNSGVGKSSVFYVVGKRPLKVGKKICEFCTDKIPKISLKTSGRKASINISTNSPNGALDLLLECAGEDDFKPLSIVYDFDIEIEIDENYLSASIKGKHNEYPAYEVYIGDHLVYQFDETEGIAPDLVKVATGLSATKEVDLIKERINMGNFNPGIAVQAPEACAADSPCPENCPDPDNLF
jgi:hypothetical protein